MSLLISGDLRLAKGYTRPDDADAVAYIAAVETADGQALETATRMAINSFVKGCKADGIWPAIKASCILAGARTLTGALIPLAGNAPTNFNFVSGDYNRKTGLVGDGSTKYLNSNRANNADIQDNHHLTCFLGATAPDTGSFIGSRTTTGFKIILPASPSISNGVLGRRMGANSALTDLEIAGNPTGFHGLSRSASGAYTRRVATANASISATSETTTSSPNYVFALPTAFDNTTPSTFTATRLAFYSIGESLNLALLDARVTDLINAFAAAIP